MKHKTYLIIGGILIGILILNNVHSIDDLKQQIPLLGCLDYDYQMEFNEDELPVEIEFYILENGNEEYFKREIVNDRFESTLLHCGHDYKVIYTFNNYEPFIDYISIPESNPVIRKVTKISIK